MRHNIKIYLSGIYWITLFKFSIPQKKNTRFQIVLLLTIFTIFLTTFSVYWLSGLRYHNLIFLQLSSSVMIKEGCKIIFKKYIIISYHIY